jgi:hypothetical protein
MLKFINPDPGSGIRNLFDPGPGITDGKNSGPQRWIFLYLFRSGIIIADPEQNPLLSMIEISLNSTVGVKIPNSRLDFNARSTRYLLDFIQIFVSK